MAYKHHSAILETRGKRLALPVTSQPVYIKIGRGVALGYRRNTTGGMWLVRGADGRGGRWIKNIGLADDYNSANNDTVFNYWQAQQCALTLARPDVAGAGGESTPPTVAEALTQYEADLNTRRGDPGNAARVCTHLSAELRDKPVGLLTARELKKWRDGLVRAVTPATVKRICGAFKAALNLTANHDPRIVNRQAWAIGLAPLPDAEIARNTVLKDPEIRALIGAAYNDSEEFGLFIETAAVTGARASQLGKLEIRDLLDSDSTPE